METKKLMVPRFWLIYLEYGDAEDMTDEEVQEADAFLEKWKKEGYNYGWVGEEYNEFALFPDRHTYGAVHEVYMVLAR